MLKREITIRQAILAIALLLLVASAWTWQSVNTPSFTISDVGSFGVIGIAMITIPAMIITCWDSVSMLRDPAQRAAARKRADMDAKNRY